MTSGMLSSLFTTAVLVLFLLSVTAVNSQETITSISGRNVPVHLIQEHFRKPLTASDYGKNLIYELTDKNVIQGPDFHIDLQSDVRSSVKRSSVPPTVTLNGNARAAPLARLRTLKAKSYNIIVDDESGQILSVIGNGIALAPLHKTELPGIFVNKGAFSKRDLDLASDIRLLEKDQGLDNSSNNDDVLVREDDQVSGRSRTSLGSLTDVSTRQTGSCASGTTHYVEVAVAYDNTFCALFNNDENSATAAVQELVDESNVAYGMNTCVQLALVHVEAHCNDPNDPYASFTTFTSNQILDGFQDFWVQSRGNVVRDAAYLVTGFMDGTSVAGVAFVSAACNNRFGYGWVEGARTIVFAHEVGHTIGGNHTPTGIMSATVGGATQFLFTDTSAAQFANFIDNRGGSTCIETTRPPGLPGGTSAPPTTATVAPTLPPSQTCSARFNRNRALICRNRRLQQINFTFRGDSVGRLRIILSQRNGEFIVRYRATGRLFMTRFRDVVSTDEDVVANLGDFETLTGGVTRVNSAHEAGVLPIPSGARSCCGQDLFIGSDVMVCLTDNGNTFCQTIMDTYTNRVICRNVCRRNPSGVFTPMSEDQACPSCV